MTKKIPPEYSWERWATYSALTIKTPVILRLDGNNFHNLTCLSNFKLPFDERFHQAMINTASDIMLETDFQAHLSYTSSDEINLLFTNNSPLPYSGRLEKILSLLSAYASSSFQYQMADLLKENALLSFETRIIKINNLNEILKYFVWRISVAYRSFQNVYVQHFKQLNEKFKKERNKDLVIENLLDVPKWQKYGTILYRKNFKTFTNKKTTRRSIANKQKLCRSTVNLLNYTGHKWLKKTIKNI